MATKKKTPAATIADREHAAESDAQISNLQRLIEDISARTAGGSVDDDLRAFLDIEAAEISERDDPTVTLSGVTASSHLGLHQALQDWCTQAARWITELKTA
ncbi:MAG: hypothetical protein V4712_15225 [Pseudomonadota bacterium]